MEYVYAALLLHKQQKEINEENVTNVIKAAGAEPDQAQVKSLVAALADVNIEEAIKSAPVAMAGAAAGAGGGSQAAEESGEKKEENKEIETPSSKNEEQAMEGLSSLFG